MIGEIGGNAEEEAAAYVKANMTKPVSASWRDRPRQGKRMGHAAPSSGGKGTAAEKIERSGGGDLRVRDTLRHGKTSPASRLKVN